MAQPKLKQIGKYQVVDILGRGGMGVVYKAIDPAIGRTVAIKMMTGAFADDPDMLSRFYREARSTGNLQHPNIVTVHDLGDQDGSPYLVMEFLEGEALEKLILARRPMPLIEKLGIMAQVCEGLQYAHDRSIVHRDIKPANIVIVKDGTIKIVDFGIARMGNEGLTRPGQVVGSIQFMSPEQINGAAVDCRSDLFSAGIVLFQFLTFELPFEGKDTGSTLLSIINEPPKPLSSLLSDCPAELETIVFRALAKDPAERYQTAEEFGIDLARVEDSLKVGLVENSLQQVDQLMKAQEWSKAKDSLQAVLKLDRKNTRANTIQKELQQIISRQQRSAEAEQFRALAEQALQANKVDEALHHLEKAISLDQGNTDAFNLHKQLKAAKEKSLRVEQAMKRAESAMYAGALDDARQALEEALDFDPGHEQAKALKAQVEKRLDDALKQQQVQRVVDEARKRIASRKFTAALEILHQAVTMGATTTTLNELISIAKTGREQEKRRRELEQVVAEVQDALNADDYKTACAKVADGLERFPNDSGLRKLSSLAESQRQLAEKRQAVERVISEARKLMDQGDSRRALDLLSEAGKKYPKEADVQAMLAIIAETLAREEEKNRKDSYLQTAKENIRNKSYEEAIRGLEEACSEFGPAEFESLLRYAKEEKAAFERRQVIDQVAQQAQKLAEEDQLDRAVEVLESALKSGPDEELQIILADIRRAAVEHATRITECIDSAHRLIRGRKPGEAVKLLESQPKSFQSNNAFRDALETARREQIRIHASQQAETAAREALLRSDYAAADAALQQGLAASPGDADLLVVAAELKTKRCHRAESVLNKALKDSRMLLLVQSYESALEILERCADWVAFAPQELASEHRTIHEEAAAALQKRAQKPATPLPAPPQSGGTVIGGWVEDATVVRGAEAAAGSEKAHEPAVQGQTLVGMPEIPEFQAKSQPVTQATPSSPEAAVAAVPARDPAPSAARPAPAAPKPVKVIEEEKKAIAVSAPQARKGDRQRAPADKGKDEKKQRDMSAAQAPSSAASPSSEKPKPTPLPDTAKSVAAMSRANSGAVQPQAKDVKAAPLPPAPKFVELPVATGTEAPLDNSARPGFNIKIIGGLAAAVVVLIIGAVLMTSKKTPVNTPAQPSSTPAESVPSASVPPSANSAASHSTSGPTATPSAPPEVKPSAPAESKLSPRAPVEIAAKPARLRVSGAEPGARIAVDGRFVGSAARNGTFSTDVPAGDHEIAFQHDGFQPKSLRHNFPAGGTISLGRQDVALIRTAEVKPAAAPPVNIPAAAAANEARQEWASISNSNDSLAIERYISKYPNSPNLADANRRLAELRAKSSSEPAADKTTTAAKPPPAVSTPAPAASAVDALAADRQGIISTLNRYAAAYRDRNAEELAQVWPGLDREERRKIEASFKAAKAIDITLKPVSGPAVNGNSASVTCSRMLRFTFPQGSPAPHQDQITVQLRRQNGTWLVESVH